MTLYGSAPDPLYLRTQGREGYPMGCGGTCPTCRPYAEDQARRRSGMPVRPRPPESTSERPAKDPRYSWLPP